MKVGDRVTCRSNDIITLAKDTKILYGRMIDFLNSKEEFIISRLTSYNREICKLEGDDSWYDLNWFEKIKPQYEIDKKYIVSDYKECFDNKKYCENEDNHRVLIAYLLYKKLPFICGSTTGVSSTFHGFKYIKHIEYKPYSETKHEWIGKKVIDNFGTVSTIKMVGKDCVNFTQNDKEETCYDLFKRYTWEDGSIIGELINES